MKDGAATELRPFARAAEGFPGLIRVERYGQRTDVFDRIVAETHTHFWDPLNPDYVDLRAPFDLSAQAVMPFSMIAELNSAVADRLDDAGRTAFANDTARWWLSNFLHGEQAALSFSVSLCRDLDNLGTIEYAANQAREEARHVLAFSTYIQTRWGTPLPASPVFGKLLQDIVDAPEPYKRIVGMQLLVEGLAMGLMAALHTNTSDPTLARLAQLVMSDEAFHHKAGRIWSKVDLPYLTDEEKEKAEAFALECFDALMFNVMHPSQKQVIYDRYGFDWKWVREAMKESYTSEVRRQELAATNSAFRIVMRTLVNSGVVSQKTEGAYAAWVPIDDLRSERDGSIEERITAEGLEYLRRINDSKRQRHRRETAHD
ncbi:MAG: ferritin-like domain-containing protein [Sulfurifustis sp.]